jgi:hypothetical protein
VRSFVSTIINVYVYRIFTKYCSCIYILKEIINENTLWSSHKQHLKRSRRSSDSLHQPVQALFLWTHVDPPIVRLHVVPKPGTQPGPLEIKQTLVGANRSLEQQKSAESDNNHSVK